MNVQSVSSQPSFKGNLIEKNPGTAYIASTLKENPIFQNFLNRYNGDIFLDASCKNAPKCDVLRGGDEELYKIYLSTKELPKTIKGIIKSWFDPAFKKTSLTRHYREERQVLQAIQNKEKLTENLKKLDD